MFWLMQFQGKFMEKIRGFKDQNQDATENRERRADVLLRFLNVAKNIEPLQGQKFETVFSDEKHKREFIENLSTGEFLQLLNGLNGILRGKKKEDWRMDGENVGVGGNVFTGLAYISPRQEDKPELLEKLLFSVKEMSKGGRNLKDVALAVSATINAIHPFLDGNGRTSRLLYSVLSENYTDESKEKLKMILSKSATLDGTEININPGLIQTKIKDLIESDVGIRNPKINQDNITNLFYFPGQKLKFNLEINEKDKNLFIELLKKDAQFIFWSVFIFFHDNANLDRERFINKFPKRAAILIDVLSKNLSQEQLSQILQNYRNLKKRYVEKLIGSIANPENEEYQIEIEGQKIPLKTYFENEIKEKQKKESKKKE